MSAALLPAAPARTGLGAALLAHLDDQIASTRRLLQTRPAPRRAAIRDRDVDGVLACVTEIQGEMERRGRPRARPRASCSPAPARSSASPPHVVTLDAHLLAHRARRGRRGPRAQRRAARPARRGRPPAPGQPHPHAPGARLPRAPHPPARRRGARRLRACRARSAPAHPAAANPPPRPGPAGMTSISTFIGLQTSLRGLLAQQRSLDVTAHNIANAQTVGYTRQEAVLGTATPLDDRRRRARRRRRRAARPGRRRPEPTAACATRSSTSSTAAQNMALGEQTTTADGLVARRGRARRAGRRRHLRPARPVLGRVGRRSRPTRADRRRQGAVVTSGQAARRRAEATSTPACGSLSDTAAAEYASLTTAAGNDVGAYANQLARSTRRSRSRWPSAASPTTCSTARPPPRQALRARRRSRRATRTATARSTSSFGGAAQPLVDGATGAVTWPQTLTSPGGKLGALQNLQTTIAGYRTQLDAVASEPRRPA